ncbi:MAG: hypothetical protein QW404_02540 [Candidatus Nanoarchaeia archaeon]
MKKKITSTFLVLTAMLLSIGLVNALDINVDNYYPTPVQAGEYFTIWIRVSNNENNAVQNSAIRFKESYPFSLDPTEEPEIVIDTLNAKSAVTKRFKVRVDEQAKEGDNSIVFEYKDCAGCQWKEKTMPITVVEAQTSFDVVLQEITTEGVFIAIANIGKNPANAITVSIPEQENFMTELTSASIVGNLESGDYTIVSFKISPKQRGVSEKKELTVQVDYTDPFGARRTAIKQILVNPATLSGSAMTGTAGTFAGRTSTGTTSSFLKNTWFWVSVALAILLVIGPVRKLLGKRRLSKRI